MAVVGMVTTSGLVGKLTCKPASIVSECREFDSSKTTICVLFFFRSGKRENVSQPLVGKL